MPLNFEEEKELQELKHKHKCDFEHIRHTNKMEEAEMELRIVMYQASMLRDDIKRETDLI